MIDKLKTRLEELKKQYEEGSKQLSENRTHVVAIGYYV